jgi:hypothetical protein
LSRRFVFAAKTSRHGFCCGSTFCPTAGLCSAHGAYDRSFDMGRAQDQALVPV